MNDASQNPGSSRARSAVAWGLAPVGWFLGLLAWLWSGMILSGSVHIALLIVLLVLPAPWLLWASWRMPRPSLKTYLAEGGALVTGLVSLYLAILTYMMANAGPAPLVLTLILFAAAAVFVAAAWPLPGRRIAYGAAALACVVLGIGLRVLYSDTSYYPGIDFVTKDDLFLAAFLGLPALGALVQVVWWRRGKRLAA